MSILGYILDEVISAVRRNSVHGPPSEHWYPNATTREALKLGAHTCFYCLRYDTGHRRVTEPPCPGKSKGE